MAEVTVTLLGEDDWEQYKAVRLAALQDAPHAFANSYDEEAAYEEDIWRDRMIRSKRFGAFVENELVGTVSLSPRAPQEGDDEIDSLDAADVFGLWVAPQARGGSAPADLIAAAADAARADSRTHLVYWVGVENGRAVAFASGYGFRPTDARRKARTAGAEGGVEAAMVFPLASQY